MIAARNRFRYCSTLALRGVAGQAPILRPSISGSDLPIPLCKDPERNSDDDRLRLALATRCDVANFQRLLRVRMQLRQRLLDVFTSHNDRHADAAVEDAMHFVIGNLALALQRFP